MRLASTLLVQNLHAYFEGNGIQGAAVLPSAKKRNSSVLSDNKPNTSHLADSNPNYRPPSDKKKSSASTAKGTKSALLPKKRETGLSASDSKSTTSLLSKKPNASVSPSKKTSPSTKKDRSSSPLDKKASASSPGKKTNAGTSSNKKATSPSSKKSGSNSSLDKKSFASSSSDRSRTPSPLSKRKQSGSLPSESRKSLSPPTEKGEGSSKKSAAASSLNKQRKISLDSGKTSSNSPPSDKKAAASSPFDKTKNSIRTSYRKISNSLLPDKSKSASASPETRKTSASLSSDKAAIAKELEQAIGKAGSSPSTEKKTVSKELEEAIAGVASSPSPEKKEVAISSSDNQKSTTTNLDEKSVSSSSSNKKKGDKQSRSSKLFSRLTALTLKPRSVPADKPLRRLRSSGDDALATVTDDIECEGQVALPTTNINLPQQPVFRMQAADKKLKPVSKESKEQDENCERKNLIGLQSLGSTLESVSESDEGNVVKRSSPIKPMMPSTEWSADEESRLRANSFGSARKSVANSGHLYAKTPLGPSTSFEARPNVVRARRRSNSVGDTLDDEEDSEENPKLQLKQTVALKPNFSKHKRPLSVGDMLKPIGDLKKRTKVEKESRTSPDIKKEDRNTDVDKKSSPTSAKPEPTASVQMQSSVMEKMNTSTYSKEGSKEKTQPVSLETKPKLRPLSMGDLSKLVPDSGKFVTSETRSKKAANQTKLHAVAVDILTDGLDEEDEESIQESPMSVSSTVRATLESEVEKEKPKPTTAAVKPTETETLTKPTTLEDSQKPSAGSDDAEKGKKTAIFPKKPELAAKARPVSVPFDSAKVNSSSPEGLNKVTKQSEFSFDDKLEQISGENPSETESSEQSGAPVKPFIAQKPKWRSRTVGSKILDGELDEVIDNGHQNGDSNSLPFGLRQDKHKMFNC